jgi:Peptidase propeptide and YPEB domain
MQRRNILIAIGVLVVVLSAGGGIAWATGGDDDDKPLTGATLERATAAALRHTGGGTVTETELGDDGAAYGVEVRRPDGTQVEVGLDASFHVIGQERDDDGANHEQGVEDD